MLSYLDYAALSALVYNDVRVGINKPSAPIVEGWTEILYDSNFGFTAGIY